jgi:serine/threonine protein kinase
LLEQIGEIKIADFGWTIKVANNKCTKVCGTVEYLSPEMVEGLKYDEKVGKSKNFF